MLRGDTLPSMHSSFPLINLSQIREKQGKAKLEMKRHFECYLQGNWVC